FGKKRDYKNKTEKDSNIEDFFELLNEISEEGYNKYSEEINGFKLRILKGEKFKFCDRISDEFKNQMVTYANEMGSGKYNKSNGCIIGNILEHQSECEDCDGKIQEISQLVAWSTSDKKITEEDSDINVINKGIDVDIRFDTVNEIKEGHLGYCKNISKEMAEDILEYANRHARGAEIKKNDPFSKRIIKINQHFDICKHCYEHYVELYGVLKNLFELMKEEGVDLKNIDTSQMLKDYFNKNSDETTG
ncbi:MAG: hypothetical protein ACOZAR_02255, partial [Patescibacteria group bacterium]